MEPAISFPAFFKALWGDDREPFPWQTTLAERSARGDWPEAIALPTASGKTACLDVALYALAWQADLPITQRTAPRRIWFVVDRRIVVDEAYERARKVAEKLQQAIEQQQSGPIRSIAEKLRTLSGTEQSRPLAVARLRGGTCRDDGWARVPAQPAVMCSTVDQVGSALLFHAYGHSELTASIWAGLAAHDSLIILDEAHCAVPFLQTLRAIERFRGDGWAEEPLRTPFRCIVMSATPPAAIAKDRVFPAPQARAAALDHDLLRERFNCDKLAELRDTTDGDFDAEAARSACEFVAKDGRNRVAVMVNRVGTAEAIAEAVRKHAECSTEVVLLTGRMRPVDRDRLIERVRPVLSARSTAVPKQPIILVTTQCLEVGADFSFDALVTECASLDAMRQRFGRLNRLGKFNGASAVILIRRSDTKEPRDENGDPVYGRAIYETWMWLNQPPQKRPDGRVDFGISAMDACVGHLAPERRASKDKGPGLADLLAPAPDAPVLLPAHLDVLCQTAPRPVPDVDVSLFLHGKGNRAAEVRVVLRGDLPFQGTREEMASTWTDLLSILPPTSPEMLTVSLHRLRAWLTSQEAGTDPTADVQGAIEPAAEKAQRLGTARTDFLLWRGAERSVFTRGIERIVPDDVVVLPASLGLAGLGQTPMEPQGLGNEHLDEAERALRQVRGLLTLRLVPGFLKDCLSSPLEAELSELVKLQDAESDEISEFLVAWSALFASGSPHADVGQTTTVPEWLPETLAALIEDGFSKEAHPLGGWILVGNRRRRVADDRAEEGTPECDQDRANKVKELDPPDDWEEGTLECDQDRASGGQPVTLVDHSQDVRALAERFAKRCLGDKLAPTLACAAEHHDLGKLDARFQRLLHNGVEYVSKEPLAKSPRLPGSIRRWRQICDDAGLPKGFRHESLSLQLAEHFSLVERDSVISDLALHLIASHHGYARPFAPVVPDPAGLSDVPLETLGIQAVLGADERTKLVPAHCLSSGGADRFWRLVRRHGWWGLSYIEAVLRLSDWYASERPGEDRCERPQAQGWVVGHRRPGPIWHETPLDALDGSNPLAFLASLGALRLLTRAFPSSEMRLMWSQRAGAWRPVLCSQTRLDSETLVDSLHRDGLNLDCMFTAQLLAGGEPTTSMGDRRKTAPKDKLLFPVQAFRAFCQTAAARPGPMAEYAAAWASEPAGFGREDPEIAHRTRFDFTAGQQAFIGMIRELRRACSKEDVRRALLDGWRYSRDAVSMRWDPADEKRQYALQGVDPTNSSRNPPLADPGANFLAIEALPLLPRIPSRGASQPGFSESSGNLLWTWPIWCFPLGMNAIRSLLCTPFSDIVLWSPGRRAQLGVPVVFQSAVVQPSGRYRCFTPARPI